MADCLHEDFEANVEIYRLNEPESEDVHSFACEITARCAHCKKPFGFRCPDVGLLPDRPACSPDALELRVPMIPPSELELLGPLAAMRRPSDHPGFRMQRRLEP